MLTKHRLWRLVCLGFAACLRISFATAAQESLAQPMLPETYFPVPGAASEDRIFPPLTPLNSIPEGFGEHFENFSQGPGGVAANERSMWSTVNFPVTDPKHYVHIDLLDNDNPDSFWYTQRPNLFNIPVPDEWDYTNLVNTDRSDFTDTPVSVGKGGSILETGFTYTRTLSPEQRTDTRTLPEALFRFGITNEFELRIKSLGYSMISQTDRTTGQSGSISGFNDLDLGFKYEIFQQKNWIPLTTLVTGVLLPSGQNGLSANNILPHFNIVNGWAIRRYIFLKHQFGLDYMTYPGFSVSPSGTFSGPYSLVGSRSATDSFHSSISCLYQASKHVGGFVEWFVLYGSNQPTTNFLDSGLFIYLTPSIQVDCVIGSSIDASDDTVFTKAGFSTRW